MHHKHPDVGVPGASDPQSTSETIKDRSHHTKRIVPLMGDGDVETQRRSERLKKKSKDDSEDTIHSW